MHITLLYVLCLGVAFALLVHAIYTLINHFSQAGLPHPLFVVFLVSAGSIVVYALVAKWAVDNVEPKERLASFISLMICSVTIWLLFQASSLVSTAKKWSFPSRWITFFLSTALPLGTVFYVNVSRAIFALN